MRDCEIAHEKTENSEIYQDIQWNFPSISLGTPPILYAGHAHWSRLTISILVMNQPFDVKVG